MTAGMRIRRATRDDLPAIIGLLADDALGRRREDTGMPPAQCYIDAFSAIARDSNQELVVMDKAGAVVGCLQLTFIPGLSRQGAWRAQIESVRVGSTVRGQGMGHRLFEWAIARAREKGCQLIQLTTDKTRADARRFL